MSLNNDRVDDLGLCNCNCDLDYNYSFENFNGVSSAEGASCPILTKPQD